MTRRTKEQARETRREIIDAARNVFHRWGVSRASLDKIAQVAGRTRGAVYWHFKDKAELVRAVRDDALSPALQEANSVLNSGYHTAPLEAIEAALEQVFKILLERPSVRMVLETLVFRCEHVAEFADLHSEVTGPAAEFLGAMELAYREAAALGTLRPDLAPTAAAWDTRAFTYGLLYVLLESRFEEDIQSQVLNMISTHIALRRATCLPHKALSATKA